MSEFEELRRPPKRQSLLACIIVVASAATLFCGDAAAQIEGGTCGNPFVNHFGPFDYRTVDAATKALVEGAHFTPGVESMTRPSTTTYAAMAGDVGYTLHVFPNHHRALLTMTRLGERHKTDMPPGAKFTVDCYYQRAIVFRPDDTVARALYAKYLAKNGRKDEAVRQLKVGTEYAKDNALSHYNIGLVYLEMGEFDAALAQAHRARDLGLQRTELEDALRKTGRWREPAN